MNIQMPSPELTEQSRAASLPPVLPDGQRYIDRLSPREREVLDLIYAGITNKSAAIALGIAAKTVENHRKRIAEKMEVGCFAELVRLTYRETEI